MEAWAWIGGSEEMMIQMTSFMCQPQWTWTIRMNFYLTDSISITQKRVNFWRIRMNFYFTYSISIPKKESEFLLGNQRDLPFLVKRDHVRAVFMLDGRNDLHSLEKPPTEIPRYEIPGYNDYVKW